MALTLNRNIKRPEWETVSDIMVQNLDRIETLFNALESRVGFVSGTVIITDAAVPILNASDGDVFRLVTVGNRALTVPLNPTVGKRILIQHVAGGGANRTLSLATQHGGFRFGSTVTGLTATVSGKTDYIDCLYNDIAGYWDVLYVTKGY